MIVLMLVSVLVGCVATEQFGVFEASVDKPVGTLRFDELSVALETDPDREAERIVGHVWRLEGPKRLITRGGTTGTADGQFFFGNPGDRFVAGDWGVVDGVETPAMFRSANDTFYFRYTLTQGNADSQFVWTGAGPDWLPVAGDFTLD